MFVCVRVLRCRAVSKGNQGLLSNEQISFSQLLTVARGSFYTRSSELRAVRLRALVRTRALGITTRYYTR